MVVNWNRLSFLSLFAALLIGLTANSSLAAWNAILNEHFDKDPHNRAHAWPWNTPLQNPAIRWHYNPWDPYPRAEGQVRSEFCWGYQDAYFNTNVLQDEEFPGSIWCAYTNGANVNSPRWPEDADYMNNQNAWVWWEPFSTQGLHDAAVSFWLRVDLEGFSRDSLSALVVTDPNVRTIANIRANGKFGALRDENGDFAGITSFAYGTDWVYREYRLDDMRRLNADGTIRDSVSVLDQDFVAVCWIWQSDNVGVTGKGAFIDDVVISVEDGLFDLAARSMAYGYSIDEDSIYWTDSPPTYLKPTFFRLNYTVGGEGQTPDFRVTCEIDGQPSFSEVVSQPALVDSIFSIVTSNPWIAAAGDHTIRWILDSDSSMQESREDNNEIEWALNVPWTPAPQLTIHTPAHDSTEAPINLPFPIEITINDSNPDDNQFTLFLYLVNDTTGLREHPEAFDNLESVAFDFNAQQRRFSYTPDFGDRAVGTFWFVAGLANDGILGNTTLSFSSGRIWIRPLSVTGSVASPLEFTLAEPYPNPFNGEVKLEYALPYRDYVKLALFDLAGRRVALLENGVREAGAHIATWRPNGVGGGVYLAKLEAGRMSSMRKLIYTP